MISFGSFVVIRFIQSLGFAQLGKSASLPLSYSFHQRRSSMFRKLFTPSFGSPNRSSAPPKQRRKLLQNRRLHVESLEARRVFAGLLLNEILADAAGTDTPFEYVEIKGIPG